MQWIIVNILSAADLFIPLLVASDIRSPGNGMQAIIPRTSRYSLTLLYQKPGSREHCAKAAAFARFAGDLQLRLMAVEHVLDNGKAEAGASCFARAAAVHAIETLCQT